MAVSIALFIITAAVIIGPMLFFCCKPKPIEYEQRPFLNGTLHTPKD